jgi:putative ABC transport system permease protein
MLFIENVILALQSLRSNPLRSVLTLIGIAVGIGAVLYVVVLGELTQRNISQRLEALGSNVLQIRPGYSHHGGVRTGSDVVSLTWDDAKEIEQESKVITRCVPVLSSRADLEYKDQNVNTSVTGATPDYEVVSNLKLDSGRFFNDEETERKDRVCILGAKVWQDLFGTESPIGSVILLNARRFTVIGLLHIVGEDWNSPDDQVFVPITTAQDRIFGQKNLSNILAQMRSSKDYDEALFDIETILRRNHRLQPDQDNDFRVRRQDIFLTTIQETNEDIARFIIMIAMVSLFVGGIGIANIMLVSVTERVREIGVRRAIGAKRSSILAQFVTEAATLGVCGGIAGILGGLVFNYFQISGQIIVPWAWIGYSFMICALVGVMAGMYPAIRAANANVMESLRYE